MKKILVYQNDEAIQAAIEKAHETIKTCNSLINKFAIRHNHFKTKVDENFAYKLLRDPVATFDELLRANSPIKPIAGKELDIVKLAELTGINREMFISDFTVVMPGTIDRYNKQGVIALYRLDVESTKLLIWQDNEFVLNKKAVADACEVFKTYAETPQELEKLKWFENFFENLNEYCESEGVGRIDRNRIAMFLKINLDNGRFTIKPKDLVRKVKAA